MFGSGKRISVVGVTLGAAIGSIGFGYLISRATRTPANKRVLYSGVAQIVVGAILFRRLPSIGIGMMGSGAVNISAVVMSANAESLLDGSFFTTNGLPLPEANTQRQFSPSAGNDSPATQSTTSSLRMMR